jgi:hypothetical protein
MTKPEKAFFFMALILRDMWCKEIDFQNDTEEEVDAKTCVADIEIFLN